MGWCANMLAAAGVQPGERVRIVVDEPLRAQGEQLAAAAGGDARLVCFPPERPMLEPTDELLESAHWADVSLGLLADTHVEEIPARRRMLHALLAHGGRALSTDAIDAATLEGELSAPMPDLAGRAWTLLDRVQGARELHLRGGAGTDLLLRIDGRRWADDCLPLAPGGVANFPGGEICVAPLATGADGVLVADLTIPYGVAGLLAEPVTIAFAAGRVQSIEGGEAADRLRTLVADAGEGADVIAELGIGLNPALRPRGHVLFDEKAAGTAHVAIGDNTGPYGGDNRAAIHVDCVFSEPSLTADGERVEL